MKNKIYYMNFQTPVHIGAGNLWDAAYTINADTIFSALCIEALKKGGERELEKLVASVRENRLLISDAMPHINKELWIRKPIMKIHHESEGNSIQKKNYKKLNFIPLLQLNEYIGGNLDLDAANKAMSNFGTSETIVKVNMRSGEESLPYNVGQYKFAKGNGLYIIAKLESEIEELLLDSLLTGVGYTGIGGRISSGMGKFLVDCETKEIEVVRQANENRRFVSLSISLPKQEELENVNLDSQYKLVKRSGFIHSHNYADTPHKKKDLYMFQSGSSFKRKFAGDVYDVSIKGKHPVYRYGKPIFVEV